MMIEKVQQDIVFMNDNLISWNTQKQKTVALSSAEAEFMSASDQ